MPPFVAPSLWPWLCSLLPAGGFSSPFYLSVSSTHGHELWANNWATDKANCCAKWLADLSQVLKSFPHFYRVAPPPLPLFMLHICHTLDHLQVQPHNALPKDTLAILALFSKWLYFKQLNIMQLLASKATLSHPILPFATKSFPDAPANCRTTSRRVPCQLEVCPLIAAVRPVHPDHLAPLQRYRPLTITRWAPIPPPYLSLPPHHPPPG